MQINSPESTGESSINMIRGAKEIAARRQIMKTKEEIIQTIF